MQYSWADPKTLPLLSPHSEVKHRLLCEYMKEYARTLLKNPVARNFPLSIVDGFAGGGLYKTETEEEALGSPLLLIQAMQEVMFEINSSRRIKVIPKINYYFVEKDPINLSYLREQLKKRGYIGSLNICLIEGSFHEKLPSIIEDIKRRSRAERCLFFLDQYGYSQVPISSVRRILSCLKKPEVIFLFAIESLSAYLTDKNNGFDPRTIGLSMSSKEILKLVQDSKPTKKRMIIQHILHNELKSKVKAKFYTPFFIKSTKSKRSYWLIHLSNVFRANDVMTSLHWKLSNSFEHYGGAGYGMFHMLGYDHLRDMGGHQAFIFDKNGKDQTTSQLFEQIPRLLDHYDNSRARLGQFVESRANDTPASQEIVHQTFRDLFHANEIEVLTPKGNKRRSVATFNDKDIVQRPRQIRLFT